MAGLEDDIVSLADVKHVQRLVCLGSARRLVDHLLCGAWSLSIWNAPGEQFLDCPSKGWNGWIRGGLRLEMKDSVELVAPASGCMWV